MKERFGSNPWDQHETFEKRTVGPLTYTVGPQRRGPAILNFDGTFVIGGFVNGEDFRDIIAMEADTIRTDANLLLPETANPVEENGLVFFTLPRSGVRGVIYKTLEEDGRRGGYWVQVATPELLEELASRELPPKEKIEWLVRKGRDEKAKKLALASTMHWAYRDAIKRRDEQKKDT